LHGFLSLADDVVFCYTQSAEYAPEREIGVRWDDPHLAIAWPEIGAQPIISEKDRQNRSFPDAFPSSPATSS
jgi:dTDP-4-dehydrorhamnose 3,5-epimerase